MAEPTVQVPVSLIEDAAGSLEASPHQVAQPIAGRLRALLSQPTPSAEAVCACGHPEFDHGHSEGDGCLHCPCRELTATPHRIADMTPGTTFMARTNWGHEWPFVAEGGNAIRATVSGYPDGIGLHDYDIDPPTIRDVTPPSTESTK